MLGYDPASSKRAIKLTMNSDLVTKAQEAGLNVSALAEQAVAAAIMRVRTEQLEADIAQACRVHDDYLAEYGSLAFAVRIAGSATD